MKTLFLFIPHYFYSSDLLHTNYIKYLAAKYKVVVFSPIFNLNPINNYYQSPNITYLACESQYPKFWLFKNISTATAGCLDTEGNHATATDGNK